VSSVGLVLGGGGITGASFHFGALLALDMATGWHPDEADVIVGTSCGAFTAAMVRGGGLTLDTFLGDSETRDEVAERLRGLIYRRTRPRGVMRWMRRGVLPGLRRPDLNLALGSPALYDTSGIVEWVEHTLGPAADRWPDKPTVIVAYDLSDRSRVPFGTEAAPAAPIKTAVAASVAVPAVFEPVQIGGRWYADGGIASGTSADLVLANPDPLDLLVVLAPLAAVEARPGARFYEEMFDRAGRSALDAELATIREAWPHTDVVVLRPDRRVLATTRPNPLSVEAAIPAFLRTLRSLKSDLSRAGTWEILERHLVTRTARSR
jgi:NTE family protein